MADVGYWEHQVVTKFVVRAKRERYLTLLKGPKHRAKALDRLNHAFDFDSRLATPLTPEQQTPIGLVGLLRSRHVADTCYLIADGNEHDGHELQLAMGVETMLANHWGAILVCPPKPIAVYKPEAPGQSVLLESRTT